MDPTMYFIAGNQQHTTVRVAKRQTSQQITGQAPFLDSISFQLSTIGVEYLQNANGSAATTQKTNILMEAQISPQFCFRSLKLGTLAWLDLEIIMSKLRVSNFPLQVETYPKAINHLRPGLQKRISFRKPTPWKSLIKLKFSLHSLRPNCVYCLVPSMSQKCECAKYGNRTETLMSRVLGNHERGWKKIIGKWRLCKGSERAWGKNEEVRNWQGRLKDAMPSVAGGRVGKIINLSSSGVY